MNTLAFHPESTTSLAVSCVDFKWLMALEGHRVDVERLQTDPAYAGHCLVLARASKSAVLRSIARRLDEARTGATATR